MMSLHVVKCRLYNPEIRDILNILSELENEREREREGEKLVMNYITSCFWLYNHIIWIAYHILLYYNNVSDHI